MIHPTAMVDSTSEVASDAEIGPYAYIGPRCVIESGVKVGVRAIIEQDTTIGEGTVVCPNAHIGGAPQDLGYKGEHTKIKIGNNCTIREFSTIHRATVKEDWLTEIGNKTYIMASAHIAHDCKIGNNVIISGFAGISGHVRIDDFAVVSGLVGIHQFVRIGKMAMVSALSRIGKDVPAFCTVLNDNIEGLNIVGMRRRNISPEVRTEIKRALKIFQDKSFLMEEAKKELAKLEQYPEIITFRQSIENSKRGVIRN